MTAVLPKTTGELALAVLRQHAMAFAEYAPLARPGEDPEHVHQTRVATRRLRAALRVFEDVLPVQVNNLRDELEWVAAQFGPVRDLDVQVRRLRENTLALGLSQPLAPYGSWLEDQRQRTLAALEDAVRSQRFLALSDQLGAIHDLSPGAGPMRPLELDASARLRGAYRPLRKRANYLRSDSADTSLHQVRIRAKRLRYTTEFFLDLYGKPARRLIKASTALQDLLGEYQDSVVGNQRIHAAVHTAAGAWPAETSVALGRVLQWELERSQATRASVSARYRAVTRAWKRLRAVL
jgi:triphosphatase